MSETTTKELKDKLVAGGLNEEMAEKLAKQHISYLNRVYPTESLKVKSEIAMTLGIN